MTTSQILEGRGYAKNPDGSYSRPDSHQRPERQPLAAFLTPPKRKKIPSGPSQLSLSFQAAWKALHGPELTPEYRFFNARRWRFDWAHLPSMVAIELDGGIFCQGRHSRPLGYQADCEKFNTAASLGWTVMKLATGQITAERLTQIIQTIQTRTPL